ncbi:MAG: hypothetical protein ABI175_21585, partial [Polyangiales bacterium]
ARARHGARTPMALDFGVGDDVTIDTPPDAVPYRAANVLVRICGGDPALAHLRLRGPLVRHALALIVAVLAVAAQTLR